MTVDRAVLSPQHFDRWYGVINSLYLMLYGGN
jgi:hypothetical protein